MLWFVFLEKAFLGIREVHIFVLVDGDQFDRVAFVLSVAVFAQFLFSCTHICFGTWFDVDVYGQVDLEGILFHEHLWVAPLLFRFLVALNVGILGLRPGLGFVCWVFCGLVGL